MPSLLPIYEIRDELLDAARECPRLVVRAPTGSGKSTQIPQMLLDAGLLGDGQVVVLQPRRLAARLLAARVAVERNVRLGGEVGYQVRFEGACSRETRIRYVTEGVLMRQMLDDPSLRGVSAVVFDEFHERHLYGDVTLGCALELQARARPDLRVLVMSATLRAEPLERHLSPCRVLTSEGRMYPVRIEYLEKPPDAREGVWTSAARAFERLAEEGLEGNVLIFMPGAYEIQRTIGALRDSPAARGRAVLPLYGDLPPKAQDEAVAPGGGRPKIIVSTNVAETSITIEGVRAVIDSGLARISRFDPGRGLDMLLIEPISRASADQRSGRAGRTAPGRCIRLWTEREHAGRAAEALPEIRRVDLAEIALTLKAAGTTDLRAFRWLDPPEARSVDRAESLLRDLGAIDATGAITETGRRMLAFPIHPRHARMLIEAAARGAVAPAALIAALAQGRDILFPRSGKDAEDRRDDLFGDRAESDFFRRMRAFTYAERCGMDAERCTRAGIRIQSVREVAILRDQFLRIARGQGLPVNEAAPDDEAIQKCVLAGFADRLASRVDGGTLRCRLVHGRTGTLARESVVRHAPLLVAAELREIEGRDLEVILSLATAVEPDWLREMFPDDFNEHVAAHYDRGAKRVVAERQIRFRDLPLQSAPCEPDPDVAAGLLAAEAIRGEIPLPLWNETVDLWIQRADAVAKHRPDSGVRPWTEEDRAAAVRALCEGAVSAREVKSRPVLPAVRARMEPRLQALVERSAPERVELRNGKRARVDYASPGGPSIAMKIQDLYGVTETPRLFDGRVPLTVRILGPNQRPVQVTQDLAGFWTGAYPKIRQELSRRYPKHEWR